MVRDIVLDYDCPTDGTSDCRAAFLAFKADAQGQTAILNVPAHTYNFKAGSDVSLFAGIPDLTVNMAGAALTDDAGAGGYALGGAGMDYSVTSSPRLDTALAGSSSVFCKTASDAGMFAAGRYALITGFDLQGSWNSGYGAPPNPHWFEYVLVTGTDALTGEIRLGAPLRNTYKDTWPQYSRGANDGPDQGGPATIYRLDASWDCSQTFNGGTFDAVNAVNCAGRSIVFNGGAATGAGINPSQNDSIRFIDFTLPFVEVDKMVRYMSIEGASDFDQVQFQSSSVDVLHLAGRTTIGTLSGTPKKVIADPGVTIGTLKMGAGYYGRSDEVVFNGCVINEVILPGGQLEWGTDAAGVNNAWTMADGVIAVPNTHGACGWAVPGTWCFWAGEFDAETSFQILDVTQDATSTYIRTSMPGGWPDVPLYQGKLVIRNHPAPVATFTSCTGCEIILDFSRAPAGSPLCSYSRRTYDRKTLTAPAEAYSVWGTIRSIAVDVTKAFAGAQDPLTLHPISAFDNCPILGPPPSYVKARYGPTVDLRVVGNRVIAPSGVTGAAPGDAGLGLPDPQSWLPSFVQPGISSDVSADASDFSVTIEIVADQGISAGQGNGMARDFIRIDTTSNAATGAAPLKTFVRKMREVYQDGQSILAVMTHNNDGQDFSDIESLFGLPPGQGQVVFDLMNGAIGSMEGKFQVDDAKEITERLG